MNNELVKFKEGSSDLATQIKETNNGLKCMSYLLSMANNNLTPSSLSYSPQVINYNTINNIQHNIINNNQIIQKTPNHKFQNNKNRNRNYNKNCNKQYNNNRINYNKNIDNNSINTNYNKNNNKNTNYNKNNNKNTNYNKNNSKNTNYNKNNSTNNNNIKRKNKLQNSCYQNELKKTLQQVMAYQVVTDFYNHNKFLECSSCKLTTLHNIHICNCSNKHLCNKCFLRIFSDLKTDKGKNNYHNSKDYNNVTTQGFINTLQSEIKCNKCNSGNQFINSYHKMNNDITNNTLESKDFYKWKKISEMDYFSKDIWCLDKNDYPKSSDNKKCRCYSFNIFYHPKKDTFNISINPSLLKLYNTNIKAKNIILYYPFQNYLFVDTAYNALSKLMNNNKYQCLEQNCINGLINKWNYYCQQFNNILMRYKNMGENYRCNEELQKINI